MGNDSEDGWRQKLDRNLVYLADHLEINQTLFTHLKQHNVMKDWNEKEIMAHNEDHARVNAFIMCLKKRPVGDYYRFIKALVDTNQKHVAIQIDEALVNQDYPDKCQLPFHSGDNATRRDYQMEPEAGAHRKQMNYRHQSRSEEKTYHYNRVAIIGGMVDGGCQTEVWKIESIRSSSSLSYDTITANYINVGRNNKMCKATACYDNNIIYTLESQKNTRFCMYEVGSTQWQVAENMFPNTISDGFLFSQNKQLYVYGLDVSYGAMVLLRLHENKKKSLRWSQRYAVKGFAAVCSDSHIYVIGGFKFDDPPSSIMTEQRTLDTIERHTLDSNASEHRQSMSQKRRYHAVAVLGGYIYVCGGKDSDNKGLFSCEKYSIEEDRWYVINSMSTPRSRFSLISYCGKLIAIGGDDDACCELPSMEIYDPKTNCWQAVRENLKAGRCDHATVTFLGI